MIIHAPYQLLGDHHFNTTPNGTDHSVHPPGIFGCTSVVAQDPKGRLFHGRILDWNLPNELRNSSFMVRTSLYMRCMPRSLLLLFSWTMFPMAR